MYCYKVSFRDLDVDQISLGGRVLGLGMTVWLLMVVSGWQDRDDWVVLAGQMVVLCLVHTVVLALLMVAIEPVAEALEMEEEDLGCGCSSNGVV